MTQAAFTVLMLVIFCWAVLSARLARWNITGPIVLTLAGFLLANEAWRAVPVDIDAQPVHLLAEVTLAMLLFSDAARVDASALRRDVRVPARLLVIGLPLTLVLGTLAAAELVVHSGGDSVIRPPDRVSGSPQLPPCSHGQTVTWEGTAPGAAGGN